MNTISHKVEAAYKAGEIVDTPGELDLVKTITALWGVTDAQIATLIDVLRKVGYGRNPVTAATLRAVADLIESPVETAESIEARLEGKLQ